MPLTAYTGHKPYIFISYAHKDSSTVLPIIESLIDSGFRVWYDAGIEAGTEWPEYIATKLAQSSRIIVFVSKAALDSQNCRREINYAISQKKEIISIYLEDIELSRGMSMQLGTTQGMYFYRSPWETFMNELISAPILTVCREKNKTVIAKAPINNKQRTHVIPFFAIVITIFLLLVGLGIGLYPSLVPATSTASTSSDMPSITSRTPTPSTTVSPSTTVPPSTTVSPPTTVPPSTDSPTTPGKPASEGLQFKLTDNEYHVIGIGTCTDTDIVIPDTYLGTPVTVIEAYAFDRCSFLTSVTLPDTITTIGHSAFIFCENLTSIIIPDSVTTIGSDAFATCFKLTIYCEAESKPEGWHEDWEPGTRTVIWGYKEP